VFVRAAEFWNAYLLSSFAIKKEEIEIEIERKARARFFVDKAFVFVSKLFHYKDRSKFFLVCALNFSLHPPHVKFYSNTGK